MATAVRYHPFEPSVPEGVVVVVGAARSFVSTMLPLLPCPVVRSVAVTEAVTLYEPAALNVTPEIVTAPLASVVPVVVPPMAPEPDAFERTTLAPARGVVPFTVIVTETAKPALVKPVAGAVVVTAVIPLLAASEEGVIPTSAVAINTNATAAV